jgi:hypothetical protein
MIHDISITKITGSSPPPVFDAHPFCPCVPWYIRSYRNLSLHHFQLRGGGCAGTVFTIEIIFYSCGSFNKGVLKWFHLVGYCWEVLLWRRDGRKDRKREGEGWWKWHFHYMTSNSNPSISLSLTPLNYTHFLLPPPSAIQLATSPFTALQSAIRQLE